MRAPRLILLLLLVLPAAAGAGQDSVVTVLVNGIERTALLHAPAAIEAGKSYPLVIGYHGGLGTAEGYAVQSDLFAKGEAAGFLVACPQGTPVLGNPRHRVWDSGKEYARVTGGADDVGFTAALIDRIASLYTVDPRRVFATGFSNGGQMSYLLAFALADRIAAIAPMSGGRSAEGLRPARPVPVLHIHGTDDTVYPFEGGLGSHSIGRVPHVPIPEVIAEWVRFDEARPTAETELHQGWQIDRHRGLVPVDLVLVDGMGHQIAGGNDDHLPGQTLKHRPDSIARALEFFAAHPLP